MEGGGPIEQSGFSVYESPLRTHTRHIRARVQAHRQAECTVDQLMRKRERGREETSLSRERAAGEMDRGQRRK